MRSCAASPSDWFASFFQHREARFLHTHGFWVEQAKPPEDYIYENLSYSRFNRFCRVVGPHGLVSDGGPGWLTGRWAGLKSMRECGGSYL